MSNKVETVGTPAVYLGEDKCIAGDHVIVIKNKQNTKFLAYFLSTEFSKKQIEKLSQKSTVYDLYLSKIKQIQIPIPSLEEQAKVVEKLDIFYKITNDLKEGIPLLIQKNREQYNFYKEIVLER